MSILIGGRCLSMKGELSVKVIHTNLPYKTFRFFDVLGKKPIARNIYYNIFHPRLWLQVGYNSRGFRLRQCRYPLHQTKNPVCWKPGFYGDNLCGMAGRINTKSGWPDSNRRPLRPKRSALANCATPRLDDSIAQSGSKIKHTTRRRLAHPGDAFDEPVGVLLAPISDLDCLTPGRGHHVHSPTTTLVRHKSDLTPIWRPGG